MPSNDRLCTFQSRMFSGETPVLGEVGVRSHSMTSRSARPNGSGLISAASASEKMALLTPIPSARVSAATSVKPGADFNCRTARRMSLRISSSRCLSRIRCSSSWQPLPLAQTKRAANQLPWFWRGERKRLYPEEPGRAPDRGGMLVPPERL